MGCFFLGRRSFNINNMFNNNSSKKLTGFPEDFGVSLLDVLFWGELIIVTWLIMAAISLIRSLIRFYEKL